MKVVFVTVGINQWKEYTLPAIQSVHKYEPNCQVVVVDNGSEMPYPRRPNYDVVCFRNIVGYAEAMNLGMRLARKYDPDWYVVANNDVLCEGPFIKHLKKLDPCALYGNQLNSNKHGKYIDGWIFYITKEILQDLGTFDERFRYAAFEDVDYSFRAQQAGYPILKLDLPFLHMKAETRHQRPHYKLIRKENEQYFREKHGLLEVGDRASSG